MEESKKSVRKSIKEERYNVELSDYSGSIVDEETFDKKSDAIQWAKDNGRNCYARIWDNEEGKTVKEWKVKSIKESRGQTVAELLQYASPNTKVHIYTKITNDEFEGTVDELKSKHAGFLYDTIMIWSNLNHNNVVEIYCY